MLSKVFPDLDEELMYTDVYQKAAGYVFKRTIRQGKNISNSTDLKLKDKSKGRSSSMASQVPHVYRDPVLGDGDEGDKAGGFTRLERPSEGRWGNETNIYVGQENAIETSENNMDLWEIALPHRGIKVTHEVMVTKEEREYRDSFYRRNSFRFLAANLVAFKWMS